MLLIRALAKSSFVIAILSLSQWIEHKHETPVSINVSDPRPSCA